MINSRVGQASGTSLEAIADPVRLRMVRHLAAWGPASVVEIAKAVGVHVNPVRTHAAALERAGVVLRESSVPTGRGRPALRFRHHEHPPPPATDLAELLATAAGRPRGTRALARLRSIGTEWGGRRADRGVQVDEALGRLGATAAMDGDRVLLTACPCPLVAPDHPETICHLIDGAVNGMLAGTGRHVGSAE